MLIQQRLDGIPIQSGVHRDIFCKALLEEGVPVFTDTLL